MPNQTDPIYARAKELADPQMDDKERNLAIMKFSSGLLSELNDFSILRWETRAEKASIRNVIEGIKLEYLMAISEETSPENNKKIYSNSEMREAETRRRMEKDSDALQLEEDFAVKDKELSTVIEPAIEYRHTMIRILTSYLISTSARSI